MGDAISMPRRPAAILLMGVAGSGKSTIGAALSDQLGWPFRDADSFHPAANVAKMSAGVPLTDEDRWPWLAAIGTWLDERRATRQPGIVSCSALKRIYRARLLSGRPDVRLVFLKGDEALIGARMRNRTNHFMPPSLLTSQFATLEEPQPEERAMVVSVAATPPEIVAAIVAGLDA